MIRAAAIVYYTSDSPCRRCNGTLRYRNTKHKGQCANCVSCDEEEQRARNWVVKSPETLTPDDEDPEEEMLIEGWDE